MTDIVLGSNRFIDCKALVAIQQHELLRVATSPLRVSLTTPPNLPSERSVQVVDNIIESGSASNVQVVASDSSVALFWDETPLVIATRLDETRVSLRVDLRPIGINFFDDVNGLHVGGNTFAANSFSGFPTAIALG